MTVTFVPWCLAALTALCFGWLARRTDHNWGLWAVGGAAFALVTATVVFGLGHSIATPFTRAEWVRDHIRWTFEATGLVLVLGWLLTLGLHQHHRVLGRWAQRCWSAAKKSAPGRPAASQPSPAKDRPGTSLLKPEAHRGTSS